MDSFQFSFFKICERFCRERDFHVLCVNVLLTIWKISFPFLKLNFPEIFILWKLHIYTKNWTNMLTIYQSRYKIFFKIVHFAWNIHFYLKTYIPKTFGTDGRQNFVGNLIFLLKKSFFLPTALSFSTLLPTKERLRIHRCLLKEGFLYQNCI